MRSDRDTLDSAGEVGQPPVLFLLFVVSGSWEMRGFLSDQGPLGIVGADI